MKGVTRVISDSKPIREPSPDGQTGLAISIIFDRRERIEPASVTETLKTRRRMTKP